MHLILGFGATGASFLRYLRRKDIPFLIMDSRIEPPGLLEFKEIDKKKLCLGRFDTSILKKVKKILVSPGIEFENEVLVQARRVGIEILTDIEIFLEESKSTKVLVSGTNGKTSVVSMAGHVLSKIYRDKKIICCGNIGRPVLDVLSEEHSLSVIEVSSFHLEHSNNLLSEVAVLLNVDQDHLDRHHSIKNYRSIKEKILYGCNIGLKGDNSIRPNTHNKNKIFNFLDLLDPIKKEIDQSLENKWPYHEKLNIKAVLSIVLALQATKRKERLNDLVKTESDLIKKCLDSLHSFKRLEHRFEVLGVRNGLTYINDSKSTNISSLLTALNSTEKLYGKNKTLLICGGDSKGQDFSRIEPSSLESIKKVFIFGKDKEEISKEMNKKVECIISEDLQDALNKSRSFSSKGDVVLLSPSCSSTDMFSDYKDRGNKFRELSGFS